MVLVHGWAASSAAWANQLELAAHHRLVALDLRGHGESDTPAAGYDEPATWAGDIAAVLEHTGPAVLVGWSYGGLVITDYLRERGPKNVTGLVLVGALTEIGDHPGGEVGPAWDGIMRPALSEDPAVAVPALVTLVTRMTVAPASGPEVQRRLADMLRVPPAVRRALFRRSIGSAEVLAAVSVPALVVHGERDLVISPRVAEYAAGKIPGASLRWLPDVGHMPFAEEVEEFNAILRAFAGSTTSH
ncbi:MAG: alpha/beta fold hydrolase [Actinophytocola sp.]|uniref:alpha/beta fold hydrolase n=1 Tax=Actinophytocola sp. TaxID=1872138 RepID=UPI001326D45C|nr:alpha/beta hydrolase [Actinophytocola sp.]MPZ79766.1 alpha/beta fold hydrolase [Actinophytocola sp.]